MLPHMRDDKPKHSRALLEGKTLEVILSELHQHFGWEGLARQLPVNCFISKPSISSSLKFLRKTPWARTKVENLYLSFLQGRNKP